MFRFNPRKTFINFLPVINNLKQYQNSTIWIADIIAGITIALTLVPQSIAYAALAGLGPQYGLYSSLSGGIIYMVFGTIPQLSIAPTALLSLLTYSYTNDVTFGAENAAILLCFLSGIVELLCGFLHLGFLVDFVSTPVVSGFTSAAAITIASAQLKNLLGLSFQAETFIDVITNFFTHVKDIRLWDSVLSISCCIILLGFREINRWGVSPQEISNTNQVGKKIIWFLSVGRNATIVLCCAVMAFVFNKNGMNPFNLTPEIDSGLPNVSPPNFIVEYNNVTFSTMDMIKELGSGIIVVPLIAIVSNVAIAKSFSKGKVVNASQEMIAVGFSNIIGSFFSSMPVNAAFSRAAVSNASGVRTPLNGFYTGIIVILSLAFLTPYFMYIPKATLGSVIVCAVIFMVEIETTKSVWRINKLDFMILLITFIACLILGVEIGIMIGIAVNTLLVLYFAARPKVSLEIINNSSGEYLKVSIFSSLLLYPSAEYIREMIIRVDNKTYKKKNKYIVIDCEKVCKMDFTTAKCLASIIADFSKVDRNVAIQNLPNYLHNTLLKATNYNCTFLQTKHDLIEFLGDGNITALPSDNIETANGFINETFSIEKD